MRFDSLLVHYLARELDDRLAGLSARMIRMDSASLVAALETEGGNLLLDLHPARGGIVLGGALPVGTEMVLRRRARISGVSAPLDERLLVIDLDGEARAPRRITIELLGNQWNALVLDGHDRILGVLRPREAGGRRLRAGTAYQPPPQSERTGGDAPVDRGTWQELLGPVPPARRAAEMIQRLAWISPINAASLLGSAARDAAPSALDAAYERYRRLAERPDARPCVIDADQPYPLPLPGRDARPSGSLLEAMALATGAPPAGEVAAPAERAIPPEALARLRRRADALERREQRLRAQAAGAAAEAASLRSQGEVLLAHLHEVRKGATDVTLPDFAGGLLKIRLDPSLAPAENATRLYEQARRRDRAAARVPGLMASTAAEHARLLELLRRAAAGVATPEEVQQAAGRLAAPGPGTAERLPFRSYRTTGGLEVRVGRSRKDNDDLTFHHSSPSDIWLHARDVGGAHVILRWSDAGAPPRRDLTEAAVLAALHSRAHTSGTVAVDWTRRKYVRKPRKAPPGLVVPERVKTVFVEPDERIEKALRPPD